jgi:hypothetical protein
LVFLEGSLMPKAFPLEFRNDVMRVARKGETTLAQVAKDFRVSEACSAPLVDDG